MNNESPLGYFKTQNNSWGKCDIACNGCTDATNCISCNNAGKYFHKESTPNICTNIQPGYFQFENKWKLCDISCETCDQSEKYCTKCKLGYFPLEDNAQQCFLKTASPARYIFDETNKIHKRCHISCDLCRDKPDFCLYCNKIGKYYNTQKEPNKCTNTIPVNHFFDTNNEMYLTCDISCIGCKENSKKCDICNQSDTDPTKNYYPLRDNQNDCRLNPTNTYYLNTSDYIFDKCDISCFNCINQANFCLGCNEKYYKMYNNINKCVDICPDKTWSNNPIMTCSPCDISCGKCKDATKYCLSCADNYFPLEDNINSCFDICPVKYVKDDIKKICKKCPYGCDKCTLDKKCLECSETFLLNKLNSLCFKFCEKTYWPNTVNKICENCVSPCNECSSLNNCNSCVVNFYLLPDLTIENNCLPEINSPPGYFGNKINNKFERCKKECKSCTSLDKCNSCFDSYSYMDKTNECLEKCPEKFYSLSKQNYSFNLGFSLKTCEKCEVGCLTCETFEKCSSCESGYYYMESENKCYNQCPDGYYNNKNENMCSKCHLTCMTCKNNDESSCLTCDKLKELSLKNGFCTNEKCAPGSIEYKGTCLELSKCIENLDFSVPKIFNIETNPLVVKYDIKFNEKNEKCNSIKENFRIDWNNNSSLFNQSIISVDKKNYTIKSSLLEEGLFKFKIDLIFSEKILSSLESETKIILNKVK
jgi:proprotein convertase subtilisin/kexin type 5